MKNIFGIHYKNGTQEELLPNFEADFPYIASYCELDKYLERKVPWHWHKEVEFFYMQKGVLEYYTPKGKTVFPAGSGGFVNSSVLHMTKPQDGVEGTIQLDHIFDTSLISGHYGSLLAQKYVEPIITAPQIEIIGLYPEDEEQNNILKLLRKSFELSATDYAYELKLRSALSEIWYMLLQLSEPIWKQKGNYTKSNDKIKLMMGYIQEHYADKIAISEVAAAAFISERECYRTFHQKLNMTPVEYIKSYRLQRACAMLANDKESIAYISQVCGMGSSSYFGKVFLEYMGCTPKEYQKRMAEI